MNPVFQSPKLTPEEALLILHQAADNVTLDGKNHKILQEALRTIGEAIKPKKDEPPPAQ